MDKKEAKANRWAWLPTMMPRVAVLLAEKRRELGAAYVSECWERGVVKLEPGWFYAREGPLAVGVPAQNEDGVPLDDIPQYTASQALLLLRDPREAGRGAR